MSGFGDGARFRIVDDFAQILSEGDRWDRLVERSEFPNVFALIGFAKAWWHAFRREGATLRVVLGEDQGGNLRLVAPFFVDAIGRRVWRLIGHVRADYTNLVMEPADRRVLWSFLEWMWGRTDWDVLEITRVPAPSEVLDVFPDAVEPEVAIGSLARLWLDLRKPIVLRRWRREHLWASGEALRANAELLGRKSFRERVGALRRYGPVAYETLTDPAEIEARLDQFMDLHSREWRSRVERNFFDEAANRVFYRALVEELPAGVVRLDLLRAGSRVAAAHFGFQWAGRVYVYKWAYEPDLARFSPGKILVAYLLQKAVADRFDEVDLLMGGEGYKRRYAPQTRLTGSLRIFRSRMGAARMLL